MTVNEEEKRTYVMPSDSDLYLSEVLPTSNPLRITWAILEDEEKAGFLQAALRRLESLNFVGKKVSFWQELKFPRIAPGIPPNFEDAPREVKRAQVVWAADIAREELYVKRRNTEACIALGLLQASTVPLASDSADTPALVKELLHRWITQWRRL